MLSSLLPEVSTSLNQIALKNFSSINASTMETKEAE